MYVLATHICVGSTEMWCQHKYVLLTRTCVLATHVCVANTGILQDYKAHLHEFHKLYIELLQAHAAFFAVILLLESQNCAGALRTLPFHKIFKDVH